MLHLPEPTGPPSAASPAFDVPVALVVIGAVPWALAETADSEAVAVAARTRPVWYVEPPAVAAACETARVVSEPAGPVERVWLEVPGTGTVGYDDVRAADYAGLLASWLHFHRAARREVWLLDPSAEDVAASLLPERLLRVPQRLRPAAT